MESASEEEVLANIRRRVCGLMSKGRGEFSNTPDYDDYLEVREDLIGQFIDLQSIQSVEEAAMVRERLNTILSDYEIANEEQILAAKAVEDERRKEKAKKVVESEGLFFERINADYDQRDAVISHPLDTGNFSSISAQLLPTTGSSGFEQTRRKCRLIPSNVTTTLSVAEQISSTLSASGVVGLWKVKASQSIQKAFAFITSM